MKKQKIIRRIKPRQNENGIGDNLPHPKQMLRPQAKRAKGQ